MPRTGAFRFCRSCQFDFDATIPPPVVPLAATAPLAATSSGVAETKSGPGIVAKVLVLLVMLAILGGAYTVLTGGRLLPSTSGVSSADIPPAGVIWFGSSFDATTFAISSRLNVVSAHQGFSFVAHLTRVMDSSALAIRTSFNGQLVGTTAIGAKGTGDVWGFSPGPLFAAGQWQYDVTDIGGNVLATGTISATP